jgi:hypothetical protein
MASGPASTPPSTHTPPSSEDNMSPPPPLEAFRKQQDEDLLDKVTLSSLFILTFWWSQYCRICSHFRILNIKKLRSPLYTPLKDSVFFCPSLLPMSLSFALRPVFYVVYP